MIRRFFQVLFTALLLSSTLTNTSPAEVKSKAAATDPKAHNKTPRLCHARKPYPTRRSLTVQR
jgi:hypothetical protein